MISKPVGFRLNPNTDADIIKDLDKYKDRTSRLKEVYRRVLAIEQQKYPGALTQHQIDRAATETQVATEVLPQRQIDKLVVANNIQEEEKVVNTPEEVKEEHKREDFFWQNFPEPTVKPSPLAKNKDKEQLRSSVKSRLLGNNF